MNDVPAELLRDFATWAEVKAWDVDLMLLDELLLRTSYDEHARRMHELTQDRAHRSPNKVRADFGRSIEIELEGAPGPGNAASSGSTRSSRRGTTFRSANVDG